MQNSCPSCFLCSSACVVTTHEQFCARMGWLDVRMVTIDSRKCRIHMGKQGRVLSLAKLVCVANGCSHIQVAVWFGFSGKSGLLHSLAFRLQQRLRTGTLLCVVLFTACTTLVCWAICLADFLVCIAPSIHSLLCKTPCKYLCTTDV